MNWYAMAFSKYADFSGRSRRKEYWMFNLFNALIVVGIVFIGAVLGSEDYVMYPLGIYVLAIIIPGLALTVRRLHDQGKSGWYMLVRCIPIIGGIWFLVLMCTDGEYNSNLYGLNPKQPVDNEIQDIGSVEV
ncbi:DUF805 domain-containing protein [Maribacter sp.]|uniref:DUF805 domain-containing protein n=1 Tax=Maribacter sp. TaxID=1897614 RepID=UPI0025B9E55C|nr:DUF805 domain-containing protein [Maribacter sp.]